MLAESGKSTGRSKGEKKTSLMHEGAGDIAWVRRLTKRKNKGKSSRRVAWKRGRYAVT